jgi:hypothetical protein
MRPNAIEVWCANDAGHGKHSFWLSYDAWCEHPFDQPFVCQVCLRFVPWQLGEAASKTLMKSQGLNITEGAKFIHV